MKLKLFSAIFLIVFQLGLLFAQTDVVTQQSDYNYQINPGDKIQIIWIDIGIDGKQIEKSSIYTVREDGTIFHELIGTVKLAGYNLKDAEGILIEKFKRFFNNPKVSISIIQKRNIKVLLYGEVNRPGVYVIQPGTRVAEFIIQEGGTSPEADLSSIYITRADGNTTFFNMERYLFSNDPSGNIILKDGDKVIVPKLSPEKLFKTSSKNYILQYGNVVEITISEATMLETGSARSETYTIDKEGNIFHSLFGLVHLGGLTIEKAQEILTKMAKKYYSNPYVNIIVKEISARNVFVFGEVRRPGIYPIRGNIKIAEFLAQIGGVTKDADITDITITRSNGQVVKFNMKTFLYKRQDEQNIFLEDGDRIIVPSKKRGFFYRLAEKLYPLTTIAGLASTTVFVILALKGGF